MDNLDHGLLRLAHERGLIDAIQFDVLRGRIAQGSKAIELLQECRIDHDAIAKLKADQQSRSIPKQFDGYRIKRSIGRGGMAVVLLATRQKSGEDIAIKVLSPHIDQLPTSRERFHREVRNLARLVHPNVIRWYGSGEINQRPYLAIEYMPGGDVLQALDKSPSGTLPESTVMRILLDMARALAVVDDEGMVHRDLKPANIFLAADGTAKLADLGLSKTADDASGLTIVGTSVGTPAYMSPEQACGRADLDIRSDFFSLGTTAYHLLTGKAPFTGSSKADILRSVVKDQAKPVRELVPRISKNAAKIVHQLLSKNRDDRPATADILVTQLESLTGTASFRRNPARSTSTRQNEAPAQDSAPSKGKTSVNLAPTS
ncbi:MAG: serine/threonine-protein kinase, partial [Planctomycetota bacterium]|nr:serine/threonine-protein kinase [Planctomycetota bacterium]